MSQKHIRKEAGFNRVKAFFNWIWLKAANPKLWTITICATYLILMGGWIPAIIQPPGSLENAFGLTIMYILSSMVVVGSATGVFSAFYGVFRVEKWSVVMVGMGLLMYIFVVHYLHWTADGNRLPQAQTITALMPTFVVRFMHVTKNHRADNDELLINKDP